MDYEQCKTARLAGLGVKKNGAERKLMRNVNYVKEP